MAASPVIAHKFSLAFAFISLALVGRFAHASAGTCGSDAVEAVGSFFKLEAFYYPYAKEDGKLIAESCKFWPTDPARTITAFAYDGGGPQKKFLLAIVNSETSEVASSYSDSLPEEDAATRIGYESVQLDTAPYILSKAIRAFGVVYRIRLEPSRMAESGTGDELQLFVAEGNRIRPIFDRPLPLYYWRREITDCSDSCRVFDTYLTVQVLKSASNGFFDLKLTARNDDGPGSPQPKSKRTLSHTVKYDGKKYNLSSWAWDIRFSCWSDPSSCSAPNKSLEADGSAAAQLER